MTDLARRGIRSLAVARTNDDGKWQMLGILTFLDPPRPDTKITLERAMEAGVDVKVRDFDWRGDKRGGLRRSLFFALRAARGNEVPLVLC